jgi:hypothetical protein
VGGREGGREGGRALSASDRKTERERLKRRERESGGRGAVLLPIVMGTLNATPPPRRAAVYLRTSTLTIGMVSSVSN